ncbi:hypothetical protein EBT16_01905 [bacterium]|nr:hypothetical protein [bacterium]
MGILDEMREAAASQPQRQTPQSSAKDVSAKAWLEGLDVVYYTSDAGVDSLVRDMYHRLGRYSVETPLLCSLDVETMPIASIRKKYHDLTLEVRAAKDRAEGWSNNATLERKHKNARKLEIENIKLEHGGKIPDWYSEEEIEARHKANLEAELKQKAADKAYAEKCYEDFLEHAKAHEKAGLNPHLGEIRLLQLYFPGTPSAAVFIVDRMYVSKEAWLRLGSVFADKRIVCFGHNFTFDTMMMMASGVEFGRVPHCSLLQAQSLISLTTVRKTLAERCQVVLGKKVAKEQQNSDWSKPELSAEQLEYAAADVVASSQLFFAQHHLINERSPGGSGQRLEVENCRRVYDILRGCIPAVAGIMLRGMKFDADTHLNLAKRLEEDYNAGYDTVMRAFKSVHSEGAPIVENPGSNLQVGRWIAYHLEKSPGNPITSWPRTETGAISVGADVLEENLLQMDEQFRPPLQALISWARAKKNFQDYGMPYRRHINPVTGRIHANFRIGGAETGRFSVTDPALQTINREDDFRKLFGVEEGNVVVDIDFGQIEVRVAAVLSDDKVLLSAIEEGLDIHTMTAFTCFRDKDLKIAEVCEQIWPGRELSEINPQEAARHPAMLKQFKGDEADKSFKPPFKKYRNIAKNTFFGLIYGQGPTGLYKRLRGEGYAFTKDECADIQRKLLELYAGLRQWMANTREMAEENDLIWTPSGRVYSARIDTGKRTEHGIIHYESYAYTKSINTPCQGGAAEIMDRVLWEFPKAFDAINQQIAAELGVEFNRVAALKDPRFAGLIHVVHDELVAEVPAKYGEEAKKIMENVMVDVAVKMFPTIPRTGLADGAIGKTWGEAK